MQNRECIVFERTRDTEQRIHEPCACLWVRAHPVFNQSLGRFICNMRVQVSHLPLFLFFFLFCFLFRLNNKKKNLHKIFARWHVAIAMSSKYSQYFLPYIIVSCSKNGEDKGLQVRRAKTDIHRQLFLQIQDIEKLGVVLWAGKVYTGSVKWKSFKKD